MMDLMVNCVDFADAKVSDFSYSGKESYSLEEFKFKFKLKYDGVMIPTGDVLDEIPKNNGGKGGPMFYNSNVRGILK